ncbi:MAG: hypothetical protein HY880_08815 [Deltaproteobacteria bacterium]|nr:hypothetical protein [Deltaproteobacteria bacterium]
MNKEASKTEILNYIWFVLAKRKWLLAAVFLSTVVSLLFFTYLITPLWEAKASVLVERSSKQSLSVFKDVNPTIMTMTGAGSDASNLIPILMGENMAYEIVREFKLDELGKGKRFDPKNFREKAKNWIVDIAMTPRYILQAVGILEAGEKSWIDSAAEDFIEDWQDIESEEGTSVVDITIYGETPQLAMDIANRMVELLMEKTQGFTREGASAPYKHVEAQLLAAEREMRMAEDEVVRFKKENNIVLLEEEKRVKIAKLDAYEAELLNTEKLRKEFESRLKQIVKEFEGQSEKVVVSTLVARNPLLIELEGELKDNEIKLAALLVDKKEGHPDVQKIKIQIEQSKEAIRSAVESITQSKTESFNPTYQQLVAKAIDSRTDSIAFAAREGALRVILERLRGELRVLPEKELALARLEQALDVAKAVYQALKTRLQQMVVEKESGIGEYNIRVLDRAYVSSLDSYDWPSWIIAILVALFMGSVFGLGAVFVIEYWNESVIGPRDVEKCIGVPCLGSVPEFANKRWRRP